jgi:hypothetical protein
VSRDDDLVAALDSAGDQRQSECIESAGNTDAALGPTVRSPRLFEGCDVGPVRVAVRVDERIEFRAETLAERLVRRAEVVERDAEG